MPEAKYNENKFLVSLVKIIEENLSNEQFGVSDLAERIGMSRSNLLRKVKKETNLSVSQFIRNVRLKNAKELLQEDDYNVSEISFKVGFGSTSYFIKCFREYYGYSPGEEGKQIPEISVDSHSGHNHKPNNLSSKIAWGSALIILIVFIGYLVFQPLLLSKEVKEKSIAVLPFINDSNDSTNVYFTNGLMEAILGNLQNIEDLRVISRTSVEKYRDNPKTVSEIAKELNVSYILEGSGQKIGDEILLNIQLIETKSDNHIWAEKFNRKLNNVFSLQAEIAKSVAGKIKASVKPGEIERIEKSSTENIQAYDYFLKGLDLLNYPTPENLESSIPWFHKAIREDNRFARAYAAIAISYFSQDERRQFKLYTDSINFYADKALLYDSDLPQSQIAKGLYYVSTAQYSLAESFFEKALQLRPNYDLALVFLVKLYAEYMPDPEKYLQYALFGNQIDITAYDSATTSMSYLHLSNAFIQSGFVKEAEETINKSLSFDPENIYSQYVKAYILYSKNPNLEDLSNRLLKVFEQDTTRLDVLQEVAKIYYYRKDYEKAYQYYKPFVDVRKMYNLSIYHAEDIKIARVYKQLGKTKEAQELLSTFKDFADKSTSVFKNMYLTLYYAETGQTEKALDHFKLFSQEEKMLYWNILFIHNEPVLKDLTENAEFKKAMFTIESNFRKYHERIRTDLKKKGLL